MRGRLLLLVMAAAAVCGGGLVATRSLGPRWWGTTTESQLEVPGADVGLITADQEAHAVTLRFRNPSAVPVRILGVTSGCFETCCFRVTANESIEVFPGTEVAVPAEIKAKPGPFEAPVEMYLDCGGTLHTQAFTVRGTGVEP
jgi:hypothetical protein